MNLRCRTSQSILLWGGSVGTVLLFWRFVIPRGFSYREPMMAVDRRVGIIEKDNYEEAQVEWKITDFSSVIKNEGRQYASPSFLFKDSSWHLELKPTSFSKPGFVIMGFVKDKICKHSVDYNIGFKKLDGSVEQLTTGTIDETKDFSGVNYLMRLSELRERGHELVPSNVLTVTCTMKSGTPHPTQSNESQLEKLINLDGLSQNFKDLFADQESCDTTLRVKEKEFKVHRPVLIARSSVFRALFRSDMSEKQSGVIDIIDCDADSFEEFLIFLYSGQLKNMSFSSAFHLYTTSDKYDIQDLKAFCTEYMMQSLTVENVLSVVIMADKYDDTKLMSAAQNYFNKNMDEIIDTSEWISLLENNTRFAQKLLKGMTSRIKDIDFS